MQVGCPVLLTNPSLVSPQFLCRYDNGHPDLPDLDPSSDGFTPSDYSPEVWNVDGHGHGKESRLAWFVHSFFFYEVLLYQYQRFDKSLVN
jgi:hypothetical protein